MIVKDSILSLNEIYQNINSHIISDSIPSLYLSNMIKYPNCKEYPLHFLYQLQFTEQSPIYHPEGNVWNHTLMVVDEAAKRKNDCKNPAAFMWAALLHDIGKPSTTKVKRGKITAYNHDIVGSQLAYDFLSYFTSDTFFIKYVCSLIEYHMQILYVGKNMPFANISQMMKQVDINDISQLGLCDRLGRKGASQKEIENEVKIFIKKIKTHERRN